MTTNGGTTSASPLEAELAVLRAADADWHRSARELTEALGLDASEGERVDLVAAARKLREERDRLKGELRALERRWNERHDGLCELLGATDRSGDPSDATWDELLEAEASAIDDMNAALAAEAGLRAQLTEWLLERRLERRR